MYETILIPTDGSNGSEKALEHGIDIAEKYGATVHLVYVIDVGVYDHYGGVDAFEHAEEALEETGDELLAEARERVEAASLPVESHKARTTPHEGISDTADRIDADLIVMGTERRPAEYRHMIGSVSERVIRTSPVPVHLVKADG
ncbi:MAG: universal stress protein, partial [Haloarculaceae archaeon]